MCGMGSGLLRPLVLWRRKRKPRQHRSRFMCLDSHWTGPQTNSGHPQDTSRDMLRRMMEWWGMWLDRWQSHAFDAPKAWTLSRKHCGVTRRIKTAMIWSHLCFRLTGWRMGLKEAGKGTTVKCPLSWFRKKDVRVWAKELGKMKRQADLRTTREVRSESCAD